MDKEKIPCGCCVRYDYERNPVEVLCDKHRHEENERIKKEYLNNPHK